MAAIPVVCIVAKSSGTGKTTFLEKLIRELVERGYRVGAIKSTSEFEIDKSGKDSRRYAQAGAEIICILGHERYAYIQKTPEKVKLDEVVGVFKDVDLILAEGFKDEDKPKIEIVRKAKGTDVFSSGKNLIAVVTDVENLSVEVPQFGPDDFKEVAELLEKHFLKKEIDTEMDKPHLTHFNEQGRARMVDVTGKGITEREAVARGEVRMAQETLQLIAQGKMKKGDVLAVAQVAGIVGVKETSRLIPMCHPLSIGSINIDFTLDYENNQVLIECQVKVSGQTGVEMEALTGVSIAALTIYDMCKAVDKEMVIENIRLVKKTGGKSGTFIRKGER